jgi:predicted RNA-binding protein with PUA-like domain
VRNFRDAPRRDKRQLPITRTTIPMPRRYWLVKSEPEVFSFDDLLRSPGQATSWDGVRNYQARNFMRDDMRAGDLVLFHHSSAKPPGVAGVAEVVREAYGDPTALDPSSPGHDPKSTPAEPIWVSVELKAVERFAEPVPLAELREQPALAGMELLRRGSRLSVQPVTAAEFKVVRKLGARR